MFYTNNLLRKYVRISADAETIAKALTMKSCEVEAVTQREIPKEVVIGLVKSVKPHPDADKLVVCTLDCGDKGEVQICTGATNVVVDSFVPVALVGCHLPAINLTIVPRPMRGVDSFGMICSKEELGIGLDLDKHWIWTMQGKHHRVESGHENDGEAGDFIDLTYDDCGVPLAQKYPWLENWIIDVENKTITHRPDMFGHFGLGRELATLLPDAVKFQTIDALYEKQNQGHIFQMLSHADECGIGLDVQCPEVYAYSLIQINDVTVRPSSLYTQLLLADIGQQSKTNWVDFSNIFMMSTGQPVHFFDTDKIEGDVLVRYANDGEQFTDLFERNHSLVSTDIVIADSKKILALWGIVGSNCSWIDEHTTRITVEIANFDSVVVRKTGVRLGLRTDAELRFEKFINPLYTLSCIEMLLDMVKQESVELWTTTIAWLRTHIAENQSIPLQSTIDVDWDWISRLITGESADKNFIEQATAIVTKLWCVVRNDNEITTPLWRSPDDLTQQADIAEEIARVIGYDDLAERPIIDEIEFVPYPTQVQWIRQAEELLAGAAHCTQIETYPWFDDAWLRVSEVNQSDLHTLENPLSPEQSVLRQNMRRSLLDVIIKNGQFFETVRCFDIGRVWNKQRNDANEHTMLGFALWQKQPNDQEHIHPFLEAKGIVIDLMSQRWLKGKSDFVTTDHAYAHPKQQVTITLNGKTIGSILTIHPSYLEANKLPARSIAVVAELDLSIAQWLLPKKRNLSVNYQSLQDQIISRDLSFLLERTTAYWTVTRAIQKCKEINSVRVFDLYQGNNLPEDKKSISLEIRIHGDGSLQQDDINAIMNKAIKEAESVGAVLRDA